MSDHMLIPMGGGRYCVVAHDTPLGHAFSVCDSTDGSPLAGGMTKEDALRSCAELNAEDDNR
jgi:hypothetical protein